MPRKSQPPAEPLSKLGKRFGGPTGRVIQFSKEYFAQLQRMRDEMLGKPGGVRFTYLTEQELMDKIRCDRCGGRCQQAPIPNIWKKLTFRPCR